MNYGNHQKCIYRAGSTVLWSYVIDKLSIYIINIGGKRGILPIKRHNVSLILWEVLWKFQSTREYMK